MSDTIFEITELIEADHKRMRILMSTLSSDLARETSSMEFSGWKAHVMLRVRDFQNQLLKHFDLEEEGGFMAELLSRSPQHSRQIQRLEQEHQEFVKTLEQLCHELKQVNSVKAFAESSLLDRFTTLFIQIKEHESAECRLMQEVYWQDYGGPG